MKWFIRNRTPGTLLSQSLVLVLGEGVSAAATFSGLAILARELGPDLFGQLAIIMSYALAVNLLLNFQSWRPLIRYGATDSAIDDHDALRQLLDYCATLDLVSALAATVLGLALVPAVTSVFDDITPQLLAIYCLTITVNITGHSIGLLRLKSRFRFLAFHKAGSGLIRLAAICIPTVFAFLSLKAAVIAIVVSEVISKLWLFARGYLEARRNGIAYPSGTNLADVRARFPDIVGFSIYSNINDAVLKAVQQFDVFIVALILTPTDAGYFRLIRSLGSVFSMLAESVSQVVYPNLARHRVTANGPLLTVAKTLVPPLAGVAIIGYLSFALFGRLVIEVAFGSQFEMIFPAALVFMLGSAAGIAMLPITPYFLLTGRHRQLLIAYLISSTSYLIALYFGASSLGLVGAALAFPCLYACYFFTALLMTKTVKIQKRT